MLKIKPVITIILLLSLSNCVNYRINVTTIPEKDVEVFINGVPKGKTGDDGKLQFQHTIPFLRNPVIFIKKDDYEGWFKYNLVNNNITYKNVCRYNDDVSYLNIQEIELTFLYEKNYCLNKKNCCSLDHINNYKRDYKLKPPLKPYWLTVFGFYCVVIGIVGDIIAIACFVDAKNTKETDFFGPEYTGAIGTIFMIPGTISLGFGTIMLLCSIPRWRDYNDWRYYDDRADIKPPAQSGICLKIEF